MTGFSKEDLLGKQCYHIFHKADSSHPSEGCPMEALLLSGRFESVAMEIEALEGVFLVSCTPVLNDSGDICKIIHIATDITARKRAEDALLSSLREKELLLQEIHHRVKNNLQIISSLIMLESEDKREKNTNIVLEEIGNRVRAMSLIHEKLYQSEDIASINMKDYINELTGRLISSYTNQFGKIQVRMNVEDIFFSIEIAIPFGLILNELITNAIKYAFPEEREGIITIELKRVDQSSPLPGFITQNPDSEISVKQVIFSVSDNGIGIPADMDIHTADTLGLRLVYILGELQLKGKVSIDRTGGAAFHITFPGGSHE
jgi:two-component sensor histidine kinase